MAKIIMTKRSASGIALGGIGTGSVELLPDGEFHFWQIANPPRLTEVCWEKKVYDGECRTGALSFWIRAQKPDGNSVVRKLGMRTEPEDFSSRLFPAFNVEKHMIIRVSRINEGYRFISVEFIKVCYKIPVLRVIYKSAICN